MTTQGTGHTAGQWKRGLPPGKLYEGMVDDFEVIFTVGGVKWHRRRSASEREAYIAYKARQALSASRSLAERKG